MKILQLSKYYPPAHGGIELVAEFFSRACIDLGHEVTVVSLGDNDSVYQGRFGEKVIQCLEDIKISSSPISFSYLKKIKDLLEKESPDIVFVHLPHPIAHEICKWMMPLIRAKGTRIIGIYHSDIINQVLLRDAYNLHFRRHIDVYDSFICASPNLKETSAILSTVDSRKVNVVPFCVEHKFIGKAAKKDRPFQGNFISIGRLVPYKGYEFLIDSFKNLPYQLTIVGNGPLKEKLKGLAPSNVTFAGEISEEEKFNLLTNADALIMSSINRSEAYGMTIVEAFSIGLPVIASNIDTGVSFLVRDGETGFKFPILDKPGLLRKIEMLKNNEQQMKSISRNCLSFFEQQLNFQSFKNNLAKLL